MIYIQYAESTWHEGRNEHIQFWGTLDTMNQMRVMWLKITAINFLASNQKQ